MKITTGILLSGALWVSIAVALAQVEKSDVEGVANFAQVKTTVACAGAVTPASVAGIKKMGFASIINLQLADEKGADIDAEAAAAEAAGIRFFHLPLSGSIPDPVVADRFLEIISERGKAPVFIHCASGNRAAAMWLIKRVLVDNWDNDRAIEEAAQLGLVKPELKKFALDYIKARKE